MIRVVALQLSKSIVIADVVSIGMSNGKPEHGPSRQLIGEGRIGCRHAHINMFANEMQIAIPNQGARQQSCLAQNLKAVADAQDKSSAVGKLFHLLPSPEKNGRGRRPADNRRKKIRPE